ncbi:hypothetical protein QLS71_006250 [Mariniflexile litorale]|uniref:Uncharacterized protein n=1 Tax=Mariniflexile litorale TaxID=3045158 RepID=A0AAU7EJC3_9FLAO|nr:hypothetical protein [Mariniflexile sp. KMM 9835]MDQ8211178.1 hypothetical protein [Mariniflexile sp. KMM 9835]
MKKVNYILVGIIIILLVIISTLQLKSTADSFVKDKDDLIITYSELGISESSIENNKEWFSESEIIGNQTRDSILSKLMNIESDEFISDIKNLNNNELLKNVENIKDVWKFTSHAFGFIPKTNTPMLDSNIINATTITPQENLKNSKIKITLDRLVAMDYPGKGEHNVLFDFYVKNQVQGENEHVHFNQVYRITEGQQAGISGYPVFSDLNVGKEGIDFKCYTINVENKNDKKLVGFLEGDLFSSGLKLLDKINPVTPILSGFAKGFTDQIKNRNKNIPVQDIYLGLDTEKGITTRAKLAEGSYIVIQVPNVNTWDWSNWKYKSSIGQIVSKTDETKGPQFNYFIFSVSKMK